MSPNARRIRLQGINAALFSALFLGMAPVFGKAAINAGLPPLGVVAMRTFFATLLLFVVMFVFQRKYLYIYPAGLIGCGLAGLINGWGSLLYYSALGRIDAGVGQLLYSLYPLFVAFWLFLDNQPPTRLTIVRLLLAAPAVYLLVQTGSGGMDWLGMAMMIGAAAMYALHLPINQRVLFDIPAPTVTLYTLAAMTAAVVPVYLFSGTLGDFPATTSFVWPLVALTLVTFLSRLTLFLGVKNIGGLQTALLGLGELLVTLLLARFWLGEDLNLYQWLGAVLLGISLLLVAFDQGAPPRRGRGGLLSWLTANPATALPLDLALPPEPRQPSGD
ncbi:MAG: DMT family transporter [Anaerolineae bacterium]|nr:MAG: DMT family transporter [Anaerolineae bacterium]